VENAGKMSGNAWTVAEAKAKLSELIERARTRGPQTITRNGRTAAVLVSADAWERKTKRRGNLADFFAASPLRESGLVIERSKDPPRGVSP
jgi:prevent-host-death family protein